MKKMEKVARKVLLDTGELLFANVGYLSLASDPR